MTATEYAEKLGLTVSPGALRQHEARLGEALDAVKARSIPATPRALDALYVVRGPDDDVFDLGEALGGREVRVSLLLITLGALIDSVAEARRLDGLRLYATRPLSTGPTLVRLAMSGAPGPTRVARDTAPEALTMALAGRAHVARAGVALPLFGEVGQVLGAVEAEGPAVDAALAALVALAPVAALYLP